MKQAIRQVFKFANRNRCCHACGKPYYRANRMRLWTVVNFGHRTGWRVEDVKLCPRCFDGRNAERVLTLTSVRVSHTPLRMVK